jgi:peptide/nickel transport system substrate-binding protein
MAMSEAGKALMRPSNMRALAIASMCAVLSACGRGAGRDTDANSGFPRSETLYLGGRQWGEPSTFNPLLTRPDWPVNGIDGSNLLYETLLIYNAQTGKMDPLVAESYEVTDDAITVHLNPAAHWSDGQPITGWDIKYMLDLGRKYKSLPYAPTLQYIHEVKLTDDVAGAVPAAAGKPPSSNARTVVIVLEKARLNPLVILDALAEMRVVPRHVIEPMLTAAKGEITELYNLKFDQNPVGSGPYRLLSYSSEKIVVVRDDNYWGNAVLHDGKLPAPKYIIHPIYKSNDHYSVALQQGRLDVSSNFMPRVWLKHKKGVHSWYEHAPFFLSTSIPQLFINVLHPPLGDVQMRRAMAQSINYKDIRELAVSGYSEPLTSGLILPFGLEAKYYSQEDVDKYGASSYDPPKARAILTEAGYVPVFGPNGELIETRDARGNKVPTVFIKSPTGWGDWESIVRIVVKGMRDVGIDARERFVDANLFWASLYSGDFDLIMQTPSPAPVPSKPWSRLEWVLTSLDWAPEGQKMFKDWGRFNNPKAPNYIPRIEELIALIPTLKDEGELVARYRELNVLFMQQQPTLPLVYRADPFYEFSVRHWSGWQTADNAYLPPQLPGDRAGTLVLWHLTPVSTN